MELSSKNDELKIHLLNLKSHEGFKYLMENIEHWKNQCLTEILKPGEHPEAKGEFTAYGRLLNAPDFFLRLLESNPGEGPNLDPHHD